MNVITRGVRNALRSPLKSGAIVLILAISIGLVLAMMVARSSVNAKINEVKSVTATNVTISPAGFQGGMGGGDALTNDQAKKVASTAHVSSVTSTLTDQMSADDTNLTPSLSLGNLGKRQMRFMNSENFGGPSTRIEEPAPHTSVIGTSDAPASVGATQLTSGSMINGDDNSLEALVGKNLAEKNNLSTGSTFTAYGKTITVKGIFSTGNAFQDSGVIMPLATVQALTAQPEAISSIVAKVDSSDNVSSTVTALRSALGDKADIVSEQDQIANSVKPLEGIANLALAGVIGAAVAGAVIILLAMIMIVRERRREIGVIKAIGGTNVKVIGQFITEALTLTIVGGVIGLTFGVAVSGPMTQSLVSGTTNTTGHGGPTQMAHASGAVRNSFIGGAAGQLQTNIKNVTASMTPQLFAGSVGIILLMAIIGSAIPAFLIARVRPAEVLRAE